MKLNAKQQKNLKILGFLAPILIFSLLFVYYPFCRNLLNSLYAVSDKGELLRFVGLDNFRSVFRRRDFRQFFANTLLLTAINVPVTLFLTILLGRLAMKKRRLSPVYETMFALPMSISMSAAAMIFKSMFSPTLGCVNAWLGLKLGWFESRDTARSATLSGKAWV